MKQNEPKLPTTTKKTTLFNDFFRIDCEDLSLPDGTNYKYYTLCPPYSSAVIILPITEQGTYILNREYRHPVRTFLLACPGGYLNNSESPEEGAHRELLEETGYVSDDLQYLGEAYPYAGISCQKIFYFSAYNVKKSRQTSLEPSEILETLEITPKELEVRIRSGEPTDGTLCTALFFYHQRINLTS